MKLTDLNNSKKSQSVRALKENFQVDLNLERLDSRQTVKMLNRVRGLLAESRQTTSRHGAQQDPAYLKLVMMESALSHHYGELKAQPLYQPVVTEIITEDELPSTDSEASEVGQATVVMAAKDFVDQVQKMIEQTSEAQYKKLQAVVDGIENETGTQQAEEYNEKASEAFTTLLQALTQAKQSLRQALGIVTGKAVAEAPAAFEPDETAGEELPDLGDEETGGEELPDLGDEELPELPELPEEPEEKPSRVGRNRR